MNNLLISFLVLFNLLVISSTQSTPKFSDYRNYKLTESKFILKPVTSNLKYPWGMTFIDKENLLITEKGGGLLKVNTVTGEGFKIKHFHYIGKFLY
mgnify:CR=1 FL=1